MKPVIKNGLVAGLAGLIVSLIFSLTVSGLCGPLTGILVGALAGYFTAREMGAVSGRDGARLGALSAAIAGSFILLGAVLMGVLNTGQSAQYARDSMPGEFTSPSDQAIVLGVAVIISVGIWVVIGLFGLTLAVISGAVAGHRTAAANAGQLPTGSLSLQRPARPAPSIWLPSLAFGGVIAALFALLPMLSAWMYGGASLADTIFPAAGLTVCYGGVGTLLAAGVIGLWRRVFRPKVV